MSLAPKTTFVKSQHVIHQQLRIPFASHKKFTNYDVCKFQGFPKVPRFDPQYPTQHVTMYISSPKGSDTLF